MWTTNFVGCYWGLTLLNVNCLRIYTSVYHQCATTILFSIFLFYDFFTLSFIFFLQLVYLLSLFYAHLSFGILFYQTLKPIHNLPLSTRSFFCLIYLTPSFASSFFDHRNKTYVAHVRESIAPCAMDSQFYYGKKKWQEKKK